MGVMRRLTFGVVAVTALAGPPVAAAASDAPAAPLTPAAALERLRTGNERFVSDLVPELSSDAARRTRLLGGQAPYALVLSCADSRVPPEVVFNAGLGDLFVVRSAGGVLDRSILASLEYGADQLKAPLLVVMGHEFCDIVKAATQRKPGVSMGSNLDFLLKQIEPAVVRADTAIFDEPLRAAVLANVEQIVADMQAQSPILSGLVDRGRLQIVGAFYELSTGRVSFSKPVARRAAPALTRRPAGRPATPAPAVAATPVPPKPAAPAKPQPAMPAKPPSAAQPIAQAAPPPH